MEEDDMTSELAKELAAAKANEIKAERAARYKELADEVAAYDQSEKDDEIAAEREALRQELADEVAADLAADAATDEAG